MPFDSDRYKELLLPLAVAFTTENILDAVISETEKRATEGQKPINLSAVNATAAFQDWSFPYVPVCALLWLLSFPLVVH